MSTFALCAGFFLDLLLGDPAGWPHIVRGIGWMIAVLEKAFYPMRNKRLGGIFLAVCVLFLCAAFPTTVLFLLWRLSPGRILLRKLSYAGSFSRSRA
jgi:adenosylcobinamide-phosphate synthase